MNLFAWLYIMTTAGAVFYFVRRWSREGAMKRAAMSGEKPKRGKKRTPRVRYEKDEDSWTEMDYIFAMEMMDWDGD